MFKKILSLILSVSLILTQPVFAQGVAELNIGKYLNRMPDVKPDSFRPAHLRYISYDIASNDFKLLLDQGDLEKSSGHKVTRSPEKSENALKNETNNLFNYFLIGLSLPNDKFWVNLRPDAPEQIIDPLLEKTDMGKIMLEADLQLKKDTSSLTSPQNPEGKEYWDKLYKKAGELFGTENITIPTITRPWIVPGEVIVRETENSSYVYKANLKVMLEEDYLKNSQRSSPNYKPLTSNYNFSDPRLKELNQYSTQLIKELILPRLTQEINTSKKYAQLRQVFFSLILSRWFKDKYNGKPGQYSSLIDSRNLDKLGSKDPWSKDYYFSEYKKSFQHGEYNLKEQVSTLRGQMIRSYVSGGIQPMPKRWDINSYKATAASPISVDELLAIGAIVSVIGTGISGIILINELSKNIIRGRVEILSPDDFVRMESSAIRYMLSGSEIDTILFASNKNVYEVFSQTDFKSIEDFRKWQKEQKEISREARDRIEIKLSALEKEMRPVIRVYLDGVLQELNSFKESSNSVKTDKISLATFTRELFKEFTAKDDSIKDYGALLGFINEFVMLLDKAYKEEKHYTEEHWKVRMSDSLSNLFKDTIANLRIMESRVYKAVREVSTAEGSSPLTVEEAQKTIKDQLTLLSRSYKNHPKWREIFNSYFYYADFRIEKDRDLDVLNSAISNLVKDVNKITNLELKSKLKPLVDGFKDLSKTAAKEFGLLKSDEVSSALTQDLPKDVDSPFMPGGVDFTRISYLTRPMGSFQGLDLRLPFLSKGELEGIDINKELASVEQMINARIDVSTDRLKRLLAAMSQKDAFTSQRETQLLPLLLRLCWLKEEKGAETTPDFRAVLLIADTGLFVEQGNTRHSLN